MLPALPSLAATDVVAGAVAKVALLDLGPIKYKLVKDPDGPLWDRATADLVEVDYRRFLVMCALYRDQVIVPATLVDKFWHAHILDTLKYAEDCQNALGFFLHHFPYFGMRGTEDRSALERAFELTETIWAHHFGAPCVGTKAPSLCGPANCDPSVVGARPSLCGPANCDPSVVGERPTLAAA